MRTTVPLNLHGVPVALKDASGEWVEVGYATDLNVTIHEGEWLLDAPWRPYREIVLDLDVQGTESSLGFLVRLVEDNG